MTRRQRLISAGKALLVLAGLVAATVVLGRSDLLEDTPQNRGVTHWQHLCTELGGIHDQERRSKSVVIEWCTLPGTLAPRRVQLNPAH